MALMGQSTVGPTAENLYYGDAVVPGVLQPQQFHTIPVRVNNKPFVDNGYGPLGTYGRPSSSGSLYGYGVTTGKPR